MTLTITFDARHRSRHRAGAGAEPRRAALPRLPEDVRRIGVTTAKRSPDIMLVVHLVLADGAYDKLYLAQLRQLQVTDELARMPGVGDVQVFGAARLQHAGLARSGQAGVARADGRRRHPRDARAERAGGCRRHSARRRSPRARPFQITVNAQGRLTDRDEFADIVVRTTADGRIIAIADVGRVELGARTTRSDSLLRQQAGGRPSASSSCPAPTRSKRPTRCARRWSELEADVSRRESIPRSPTTRRCSCANRSTTVVKTLLEAILLVVIVVMVFLQSWRASIIPLMAVPVSLDRHLRGDARLRLLAEQPVALRPRAGDRHRRRRRDRRRRERRALHRRGLVAARRRDEAMDEVVRPIIAIALVLCAVFMPTAFVSGHHRAVLPAVRADDRDLDGHLGRSIRSRSVRRSPPACSNRGKRRATSCNARRTVCLAGSSAGSMPSSSARPACTPTAWRGCCGCRSSRSLSMPV